MKPKMGRPKTPKDKSKTILLGAKYDPREAKAITEAIAQSGIDKSKWLRRASIEATKEWVKNDKWPADELHGNTVEFEVVTILEGPIRGTGKFDVLQRGDGLMQIKIVSFDRSSTQYTRNEIRVHIPQSGIEYIKRQPPGSTCEFSVFDPLFQKCVRGAA
jgi:hypothetical protein